MTRHTETFPVHVSFQALREDATPVALLSGLVTVVVGFAGPTALIFPLAAASYLPLPAVLSWVWCGTVITGLLTIFLSLRTRMPLLSTWSTPGLAFLTAALPGHTLQEASGAFLVSGLLILLLGTWPLLTQLMQRIPPHLAAALNAAILLPFGFHLLQAGVVQPLLVGVMVTTYFLLRAFAPRWAVAGVLVTGTLISSMFGLLHHPQVPLSPVIPTLLTPHFTLSGIVGLAMPLTLLAFTGQVVPGLAALQTNGYQPPVSLIVRSTGIASVIAALFGGHSITLGALLANIVAGREAGEPKKRYVAAVTAGALNVVLGSFAGTFLAVMTVLPAEAVTALAGLALLAAMAASLSAAFPAGIETGSLAAPAVLLVTLSGVSPLGIGAAFWGILAGLAVYAVEGWQRQRVRIITPPIQDKLDRS